MGDFSKLNVDKLKTKLEGSLKEILAQAKTAEASLAMIQKKVAQIDREAAKAEFKKLGTKLQGELERVSGEFGLDSERLKGELGKTRERVQDTLKSVKAQIKAIAEAERVKRRGRRRSE